jgi:hypothetical protein
MYKNDVTSLLYLILHLFTRKMNPCGCKCDEIVLYFENCGLFLQIFSLDSVISLLPSWQISLYKLFHT